MHPAALRRSTSSAPLTVPSSHRATTMAGSKLIVVTGVTRGLGRAMLQEFVARGHRVAGCGREEAAIEELRRTFPEPNRFATVDAFDDMQVGQWARHVLTTLGPPQLPINNAGLMHTPAPLWEILEGSVS